MTFRALGVAALIVLAMPGTAVTRSGGRDDKAVAIETAEPLTLLVLGAGLLAAPHLRRRR